MGFMGHHMCKKPDCNCNGHTVTANLLRGESRRSKWDGKEVIIVPVIMARADVPMNDARIPSEELHAESWNGVPVTLSHPSGGSGEFLSANTPDNITKWSLGRIFNSKVIDGQLRAEAWIEIARADELAPGLVAQLEAGTSMDVSTGYFADAAKEDGELGGKTYSQVHRALRPDHLALLPNEKGACSWEDGCGVRSNKRSVSVRMADTLKSIISNLQGLVTAAEKEEKLEKKVANAEELAKLGFSEDQVAAMVSAANADPKPPFKKDPEDEEDDDEDDEKAMKKKAKNVQNKADVLSPADRQALAFAHRVHNEARASLTAKIKANSDMTDEELKSFNTSQLEVMANRIKPKADFSARSQPVVHRDDSDKVKVEETGVIHAFRQKKGA